jgi:serine/threonine-protein kinase
MVQRPPSRESLFDGRYRFVRTVGQGGMATVWLAEDETLGRKVALKVLAERYAEDESFIERFRREAQAAAGLNHPNIVAIYDRGEAEGTYYIAMEYLPGPTLKDVIEREGPLDPDRAIGYTQQVLQALGFAHRHGVVHRDIKPHNIIVNDDRLKVTDFGIARAGASQMTEVGSIIGTAQYLSPEQARGQQVRPPADLYSLGVVLYEMLTGKVPFEGDSAVAIAMKQVSEPPPRPRSLNPRIPESLEQVVLRSLAKDPGLRYQSADEMTADLDRARRGVRPSAETQQVTQVLGAAAAATKIVPPASQTRVWDAPAVDERGARRPPQSPQPQRRPVWPWALVLLLLCAAAAIAAIALLGTGSLGGSSGPPTPTTASVPNVVGLTYDKAAARLAALQLIPHRQLVRSHKPLNVVVPGGVAPAVGQTVPLHSTVYLKVSKGLDLVPVASVVGQMLPAATQTLSGQNFSVTPSYVDSLQPANTVVGQRPLGTAPRNGTIVLLVSKGPPQVQVPSVSGEAQNQAQSDLVAQGFKVGTISNDSSDTVPSGSVISTNPAGGTMASQGSSVDVIVSSGPAKIMVPDETGKTQADAEADLVANNFVPQSSPIVVTSQDQDGIVVLQSPSGGTMARKGAKVILRIGSFQGGQGNGNGNGGGGDGGGGTPPGTTT